MVRELSNWLRRITSYFKNEIANHLSKTIATISLRSGKSNGNSEGYCKNKKG